MGPRFFKRGEINGSAASLAPQKRVNGATLLQAWREFTGQQESRVMHSFNGATLLQAWRAGELPIDLK